MVSAACAAGALHQRCRIRPPGARRQRSGRFRSRALPASGCVNLRTAQDGPWCKELCPAGFICPGATGEPLPCGAGGYCAGSNAVATPCPAAATATPRGSPRLMAACHATREARASRAPWLRPPARQAASRPGTVACQQCGAGTYEASRGGTACEVHQRQLVLESIPVPTPCNGGSYSNATGLTSAMNAWSAPRAARVSRAPWCRPHALPAASRPIWVRKCASSARRARTRCRAVPPLVRVALVATGAPRAARRRRPAVLATTATNWGFGAPTSAPAAPRARGARLAKPSCGRGIQRRHQRH